MPNFITHLLAAAVAVTLALPAVAQDDAPTADTVVATVGGTDITLGHMLMVRAGLPEQYQQLPPDVLWTGILDQLVQQEALSQSDDATETKRVTIALENERRALLASEAVAAAASQDLSDAAIQEAYDAKYANAEMGKEFDASHILVETEEEAQAVVAELEGGADFAAVAKEKSTGPSGPNGWFGAGMMVAPFQEAVEGMEVGTISAPVQTQFGWHVIKLNDTRTAEAPPLDEVREELTAELRDARLKEYIDGLVAEADVSRTEPGSIDASVLNQLDLLEE